MCLYTILILSYAGNEGLSSKSPSPISRWRILLIDVGNSTDGTNWLPMGAPTGSQWGSFHSPLDRRKLLFV